MLISAEPPTESMTTSDLETADFQRLTSEGEERTGITGREEVEEEGGGGGVGGVSRSDGDGVEGSNQGGDDG